MNHETGGRLSRSHRRLLLALVLGIGLLLRLTWLLESTRAPDFASPRFESLYHDHWARALANDDWSPPQGVTDPEIQQRPYFRPPGYPYALATVYRLAGPGYIAPRLVQMLLGLASCLLLYRLMRRPFGEGAALGGAAVLSSYWLLIFFETEFMAPTLLVFLVLLALGAVLRWGECFHPGRGALAGLVLGCSALVRPNLLVLPVVTAAWFLWRSRQEKVPPRRALLSVGIFLITVALAVLPATLRNWTVAGDFVPITTNAGINLFVGTWSGSDGVRPVHPELSRLTDLEGWDSFDQPKIVDAVSRHVGRPMADSEVSTWFMHRALEQVRDDPLATLRLLVRKTLLFWGPAEISNNKILTEHRRASPTLSLCLDFATLLALALLGLAHPALRNGQARPIALLALGWIALYFASYLPFFVAARFRLPLLPLLALFAGCGLHLLFTHLADRQWRRFGLVLAAFLILRLLTSTPWAPYEDPAGLYAWRQGLLYQEQGNAPQALELFDRAVTEAPERPDFRLSLAQSLTAAGNLTAAEAQYRHLLIQQPDSILLHNHLGILLARRGDLPAALTLWENALRLDPNRPTTLTNLAYTLATAPPPLRDPERALELAERALELAPGDGRVLEVLRIAKSRR